MVLPRSEGEKGSTGGREGTEWQGEVCEAGPAGGTEWAPVQATSEYMCLVSEAAGLQMNMCAFLCECLVCRTHVCHQKGLNNRFQV